MYSSYFRLSGVGHDCAIWGENRFFVFPDRLDENVLKRALDNVARKHMPILTGRIVREPKSGLYYGVECDCGLDFQWETVDDLDLSKALVDSQGDSAMTDRRFMRFFPSPMPGIGWNEALTLVRGTVFEPCGFTLVAFTIPHGVFDAASTFAFIMLWNQECNLLIGRSHQNLILPTTKPEFRFPKGSLMTDKALRARLPEGFIESKLALGAAARAPLVFAELQKTHKSKQLCLKGPGVADLKARVNQALVSQLGKDAWISTNELVYALILFGSLASRFSCSRQEDRPAHKVDWSFCAVTDLRGRTDMFPDTNYIGNAFARPTYNTQAPLPAGRDSFEDLVTYCEFMHHQIRSAVTNRQGLQDQYGQVELKYQRPDLIDSVFNYQKLDMEQNYGLDFNSWKRFEACFGITFGSNSTPLYMNNTPMYGDVCVPRMVLIVPHRPDGSLNVRLHLTLSENEKVEELAATFSLL